jgi:hypothetical protein
MFFPGEISLSGSAKAFLFCAVTLIRYPRYGGFQNSAERDSFGLGFCGDGATSLALVARVKTNSS